MSAKENRIDKPEKTQLLEWVERLEEEMRLVFGGDERRIKHALRVAGFAEELLKGEQADPYVVMAAAYLHDIGIHEAERKYGSSAGKYQEIEGPPIAETILQKMGAPQELVDEVSEIVAHHHSPGKVQTANFAVLWDADWLVNLPDEHPNLSVEKLRKIIDTVFLTDSGRRLACSIYLS
ncbi:MAG: HD domain-containing protein [bacterium]